MDLQEQLEHLKKETLAKIEDVSNLDHLNDIRVNILGKKGPLTEILRGMKDLTAEERPKVGSFANQVKRKIS